MTGPEAAQGLARGIHVAATMSIFGSALFQALIAHPARVSDHAALRLQRRIAALGWSSLAAAFVAALAWLGFQATAFADGDSVGDIMAAVPLVLFDTHFGPLIAVRFSLLIPACLILGGVVPRGTATFALAAVFGAGALELQVPLGHGISMPGDTGILLVASGVLHILAAGAWLGGLLPLTLLVAGLAPSESAAAVRRFSSLGIACVTVLAATSLVQVWALVGGLAGLLGTDYGRLALAKLSLFIALLLLAALNRFRLRPRLTGATSEFARRSLLCSIFSESALGIVVVAMAGMLMMLAPAIRQQPDWPFPWALDFSRPGIFVPAHPTSFYHSPAGFTAASIVHGGKLLAQNCADCSDESETARIGDVSDGDLYWLLGHGGDTANGLPSLDGKLSAADLWAAIDFLKARAIARRSKTELPPPAPDLPVTVDGKTVPISRLRGRILRLVAADHGEVRQIEGVITLKIEPGTDGWAAYSIVSGVDADRLWAFSFLIDATGRLVGSFPPLRDGAPDDMSFAAAEANLERCGQAATSICP
jgi:putative copper resistance protein D